MKLLSVIGIIAIIYSSVVFASNKHKVKLINVQIVYISPEYYDIGTYKFECVKKNGICSYVVVAYDIIKDLPSDIQYIVDVYRSNLDSENYKKINTYTSSLCTHDNDEYDAYISTIARTFKELGKCLQKGYYYFYRPVGFRFYDLLSEEMLEDARFKMITSLKSGNNTYYSNQADFLADDFDFSVEDDDI